MKKSILRRILSAVLVGVLVFESNISAMAAEDIVNDRTVVETEMAEMQYSEEDSVKESEETEKVEEESTVELDAEETNIDSENDEDVLQMETEEETLNEEIKQDKEEQVIIEKESSEETTEFLEEDVQEALLMALDTNTVRYIAPSGFSKVVTDGGISLRWNVVEGCDGYYLYRSTNKSVIKERLQCIVEDEDDNELTVTFTDETAELGTLYYYKVAAYFNVSGVEKEYLTSTVVNNEAKMTAISLDKDTLELVKGETTTLQLTYAPVYTTDNRTVVWSSSDNGVARVVDGSVTAVGGGEAIITATVGKYTKKCKVIVSEPITSISFADTDVTMNVGTEKTFTVFYEPYNATEDKTIMWEVDNEGVDVIEIADGNNARNIGSTAGTIKIIAKAEGTAKLTATIGDKTATCNINVVLGTQGIQLLDGKNVDVNDILLTTSKVEGEIINSTEQIKVVTLSKDSSGWIKQKAKNVIVDIEDKELVDIVVDETGIDTILKATTKGQLGDTKVTVKAGGQSATLLVHIRPEKEQNNTKVTVAPANDVIISSTELSICADEDDGVVGAYNLILGDEQNNSFQLKATVKPDTASPLVKWTSSNEQIVSVDEDGNVVAVGAGIAQIIATATNGKTDEKEFGISKSVMVAVTPIKRDIEITETRVTLYCNNQDKDEDGHTGTYLNNLNRENFAEIYQIKTNSSWSYFSSNTKVATVDQTGKVQAKAPGTAIITVKDKISGEYKAITVDVKRLVEEIQLPEKEITVAAGSRVKIPYTLYPANASKECVNTFTVEANRNDPITLGKVNAGYIEFEANTVKEPTSATIKLRIGDTQKQLTHYNIEKTICVTVQVMPKVNVITLKGTSTMHSGSSQKLSLEAKDTNGSPLLTSDLSIGFISSDDKIATVECEEKDGELIPKVTAHKGGRVTITAYACDGSNKSAKYTITVNQSPEMLEFSRNAYGVVKPNGREVSITLTPTFLPKTTSTLTKGLDWEIRGAEDSTGATISSADYFAISTSGKVTIKKNAENGMKVTIRCTSKINPGIYAETTVLVQDKKVDSVKFSKNAYEVIGLGEHVLEVSTQLTSGKTFEDNYITAYSSDTDVIGIARTETGKVIIDAVKYGTATITVCADNNVTATAKVTVYPCERGTLVAEKSSYIIQQAQYDSNNFAEIDILDAKTKKKTIDSSLFTYTSSDPDIAYVDENGFVRANPTLDSKKINANKTVTIIATLTDDPDKRTVKTQVTVCAREQIARMDVTYYDKVSEASNDKNNAMGIALSDAGKSMNYLPEGNNKFVLRVLTYGADNEYLNAEKSVNVTFSTSDESIAKIDTVNTFEITKGDGSKQYANQAVVNINKGGRFSIIIKTKDQLAYSRKISFTVYNGNPVITSDLLGTVNKSGKIQTVEFEDTSRNADCVISNDTFEMLGADGTDIVQVKVAKAAVSWTETNSKKRIMILSGNSLGIKKVAGEPHKYYLIIKQDKLKYIPDGTYDIELSVTRTGLPGEDYDLSDATGDYVTEIVKSKFKVTNVVPKFTAATVTMNTFIKDQAIKIPLQSSVKDLKITNVEIAERQQMGAEMEIVTDGKDYYVKMKKNKFNEWNRGSSVGMLNIILEGYQYPVPMKLTVNTRQTKPVITQQEIPMMLLTNNNTTSINLIDNTKKQIKDYTISCKSTNPLFNVNRNADGSVRVTVPATTILKSQGQNLKETVIIQKDDWRAPVEMVLSVKAYNSNTIPAKVTLTNGKLNININEKANETEACTKVKINVNNIALKVGMWSIDDSCTYNVKVNNKTEKRKLNDVFTVEGYKNANGEMCVKIVCKKDENGNIMIPKGTYSLKLKGMLDETSASLLKNELTANVSVTIKDVAPTAKIKLTGKLDLLTRSSSTLKGTISLENTNSIVKNVELVNNGDDFADKFYCVPKGNTFVIYARNDKPINATKVNGYVKVTLSDNEVISSLIPISFTPTQSTPKVKTPTEQNIYKSLSMQTADFDFNKGLPNGVVISKIEATSLPKGLKAQCENGHLLVTLDDKTLKAGKYKIVVNVYFNGAQALPTDQYGKAVSQTIYVNIKE